MDKKISLNLQAKQSQNLKQMQRLMMSPQMQQALNLLQLPILELSTVINLEMEANPVLEFSADAAESEETATSDLSEKELDFSDKDFEALQQLDEDFQDLFAESENFVKKRSQEEEKKQAYWESQIVAEESLFEHLMSQAHDFFTSSEELALAELIIGSLDENGYLKTSLDELAVLHGKEEENLRKVLDGIQTFEPYGVGAQNLQEAMLIQMRCLGKRDSLAYRIVEEDYDHLLHNRIPQIQKHQHCTLEEVADVIEKHIAKLDLHPGAWYATSTVQTIVPDVAIVEEEGVLSVRIQEDTWPTIRISPRYLRMLQDPGLSEETREFIEQKIASAKWLMHNILQRNQTIERIAQAVIHHQKEFLLNPKGTLVPLTMKTLAEELDVHESTVARAVNHKYVETPRGILPLRAFFTSGLEQDSGENVSSETARNLINRLIQDEDKTAPLSDEALAQLLEAKGIRCARRTVAKYRTMLKLGSARQRRKF